MLSRSRQIIRQPNVLLLRDKSETLALAKYLNCDLFVIGGAATYENFADAIDGWIITEIPETIADADVFMPPDFLAKFQDAKTLDLGDKLRVKFYEKSPRF